MKKILFLLFVSLLAFSCSAQIIKINSIVRMNKTSGAWVLEVDSTGLGAWNPLPTKAYVDSRSGGGGGGSISSIFGRVGVITAQSGDYNTTLVTEGTNLYWTQTRFNNAFTGKSTTDLSEGSNLYWTQNRFDNAFTGKSTTNLSEGTNLYWTQGRFNTAFSGKTADDLPEGSTNQYFTTTRFNSTFATKTTDNLSQGIVNKYYSSSLFNSDFGGKTTDNLSQGATNKYYATSLFNTDFSTKSTTNLAEGTNLYWTQARGRAALSATTPINYSNTTGAITHATSGATAGAYTNPSVTVDAFGHITAIANGSGIVNGNIPYIVATQYGIANDGTTNNYARLKTIIDSLVAIGDHKQGGIIYFPKGKYEFWLTSPATGYYFPRILIHGSNIQLIGEDEYNTIFQFKGTGGTDPQTNFDTFFDPTYPTDSVIVRSPGIQIKADSPTDTLRGIWVTNLTLDGGCWKLKYNNHYPTFKDQTNQWDISHKAINIYADGQTNTDDLHFVLLNSKNWMGEHIYSGGNQNKRLFIERSRFHNSNASIISCGGTLFIDKNELDSGINGMECYTGPGRSIVSNNLVHDMWDSTGSSANGIVWGGATVTAYDDMEANISGNIVWNIVKVGIYSLRMNREVKINNNTTLDCGVGIAIEPFDESVEGIDVSTNTVKTKFRTMSTGIAIFGGGSAGLLNDNVAIHDNYIYPTDTGKNNSHYITNGIQFYNTKGDASIFNNLINAHTNGLVDGQFGTNTVNYPRQYGNKYADAEFTNGYNLSSGNTVTIWPLEKFGITNFTDGSFSVFVDCDPAKALVGSEMTVTKMDNLTQYTFQSSNTHFDLATNLTLAAQYDWVTFTKGKTGKWEIKSKRQR